MQKEKVSFDCTKTERKLAIKISRRYHQWREACGMAWSSSIDTQMDILACHANGCPLNLTKMLEANADDLAHDLVGIHRNLDRRTGKLQDNFLPRFAAKPE